MDITTRVLASYYESYIILYSMHTTLESSISMHIIHIMHSTLVCTLHLLLILRKPTRNNHRPKGRRKEDRVRRAHVGDFEATPRTMHNMHSMHTSYESNSIYTALPSTTSHVLILILARVVGVYSKNKYEYESVITIEFNRSMSNRKAKRSRTSTDVAAPPSSAKRQAWSACAILREEAAALRSDHERERELRGAEAKRAAQAEARLRRQLELTTEEAVELRSALEEARARGEEDVRKAQEARREALRRAAEAERRASELEGLNDDEAANERRLEGENQLLQEKLDAMAEVVSGLRSELEGRVADAGTAMALEADTGGDGDSPTAEGAVSPAPPAIMAELNTTRIKLAEAERRNRQLMRKMATLQSDADSAVRHKEEARITNIKLDHVDSELGKLRKEKDDFHAISLQWSNFQSVIDQALQVEGDETNPVVAKEGGLAMPPEVATVVRKFQFMRDKLDSTNNILSKVKSDFERAQQMATSAKEQAEKAVAAESTLRMRTTDAEARTDKIDLDLRKLQAQEAVWKREADSLRQLLETYERAEGPDSPPPRKRANSTPSDIEDQDGPTVRGLRASISSAHERIRLLTKEEMSLKTEAGTANMECEKAQVELARVTEKFEKLRDALFSERRKAEKAEERASRAETLAGKGSFDVSSTRVLHLKENPLLDAVREKYRVEIAVLKKTLGEYEDAANVSVVHAKTPGAGKAPRAGAESSLDAEKLHRRLKESFREQIGKFREGVYMITGLKIEMIADASPVRFKVRSVYAEREDDHLVFSWPKVRKGEEHTVTMLDLLDTPQAQLLAHDPSFDYMTKFKSLPAFMASVQLGLFEKQTFVG